MIPNEPSAERLPEREVQALREAGRTEISRPAAAGLAALFLATLVAVPLLRPFSGSGEPALKPFGELGVRLAAPEGDARGEAPWSRLLAANRRLIADLRAFEDRLEDGSWPRQRLLPRLQRLLTGRLGLGNEQAYPGRDGWLYYRPDVDHLTGSGFLAPAVLARRARGGDAWEDAPQPDPVIALLDLQRQLSATGTRLVVMPTPVKPAVRPEPLAGRRAPAVPVRNPSWREFRRRLEAAGIEVVDPAPALVALEGDRYLRTDTHWRPGAREAAASLLAEVIEPDLGAAGAEFSCRRRPVVVEGLGDIAVMLRLGSDQRL